MPMTLRVPKNMSPKTRPWPWKNQQRCASGGSGGKKTEDYWAVRDPLKGNC